MCVQGIEVLRRAAYASDRLRAALRTLVMMKGAGDREEVSSGREVSDHTTHEQSTWSDGCTSSSTLLLPKVMGPSIH